MSSAAKSDSSADARALVVVGFSAGGLSPLRSMVRQLDPGIPAAVVIAHHTGRSMLPELLSAWSRIPSAFALDGETIRERRIYICPPQQHLVIKPDATFRVSPRGRVNFVRPSIDWLFESAAATYLERVIGIVLSGGQRDGARGVRRIRANGGKVIVQDPRSARQPSMPMAAAAAAEPGLMVAPEDLGRAVSFALGGLDLDACAREWEEPFRVA